MTIKKKLIIAAISIIVVAAIIVLYHNHHNASLQKNTVELQTVKVENGWGYKIYVNNKMIIYQPTVPAVDTVMAFPDKASAKRVGKIVMRKIMEGKPFSVTEEDIQHSLSY